jgi:predicted PurR-regulated permease PerM
MSEVFNKESPKWGMTTKLVVGLSMAAIVIGLVLRFRNLLGPILLAFILSYLAYPVASYLHQKLKISWGLAVTLFYLVIVMVLLGILTLSGLAIIEQTQSLINLLTNAVNTLPQTINTISNQVYKIGPFELDLRHLDLVSISNQILNIVQPLLGSVGDLVTKLAASAAGFMGWVGFVLLISFFITSGTGGLPAAFKFELPGYSYDIRRLTNDLQIIWNTFLRGELILYSLSSLIYLFLLSFLGVRYSYGLAFLAGFGRILPYIGPVIVWTTFGIVAYFQGYTMFGLSPLAYTGLVVGISILTDSAFDNFISINLMGSSLKVHPAAVLVAALVLANLMGFIGVLLAAPVLATGKLMGRYIIRKMFDQDPWEGILVAMSPPMHSYIPKRVRDGAHNLWNGISKRWVIKKGSGSE